LRVAYFYQLATHSRDDAVIVIALPGLDQELVLDAGGVGELCDLGWVIAGHDTGRALRQCGICTGGDAGRLGSQHIGDGTASFVLQLFHGHIGAVGCIHGRLHMRRED
jgi:hypothetical protein